MTKDELVALARTIALAHGLRPDLVCAIVEQESSWRTYAVRYEAWVDIGLGRCGPSNWRFPATVIEDDCNRRTIRFTRKACGCISGPPWRSNEDLWMRANGAIANPNP